MPDPTPLWVLVLSHEHGLLPLAWRLALEGAEVAVAVQRNRFGRAWSGRFQPLFPPGGRDAVARETATVTAALDRGAVVVTDCHLWRERLAGRTGVWATLPHRELSPLQVVGWVDAAGTPRGPVYLAVVDTGAWPGGQGPTRVPGAVVLIRIDREVGVRVLGSTGPNTPAGLVRVGVTLDPQGTFVPGAWTVGWDPVFYHAWTATTGSVAAWLAPAGAVELPDDPPGPRFTAAAPVSVPPWPTLCNVPPGTVDLVDLPAGLLGTTMWHDVQHVPVATADDTPQKLTTAGLDGLVGVVTAAADHWDLCRSDLGTAGGELLRRLPGGQFRVDFGEHVPRVLGLLRHLGAAY